MLFDFDKIAGMCCCIGRFRGIRLNVIENMFFEKLNGSRKTLSQAVSFFGRPRRLAIGSEQNSPVMGS